MSKQFYLNSEIATYRSGQSRPEMDPLILSILQNVDEVVHKTVDLAQAVADQAVDFGLLEVARYVVLKSDVVLGVKLNGSGNTMIEGSRLILLDAAVTQIHLTNRGRLYDQGVATVGGADTLTDTGKSWGYTTLTGTEINVPLDLESIRFNIDANGQLGFIELTDADDVEGTTLATTLQTAFDSELGADELTVAWVANGARKGHLVITNDRVGANAITLSAYELDNASLVRLGLYEPTQVLGDEDLAGMELGIIAGTGQGEEETIASFTTTQITVDTGWGTPPAAGSEYRIYKPQAGAVEILLAR